ncbi:hypothetical protein CIG75_18705 [Tumebacillus algifaecis]|uniref:Uncharacterized protein n=1 Tax=Tumebacillus algifaecis TaxID=1214604 RepID=A0A223D595_9BACL|nr:hypothetical protein [Tumebacillus algifaecis]ASS76769.1 hypothetical protein CIG75_18705 [Tumebacillus algifaecis]
MMLRDYLRTLPQSHLFDLYETLYQQETNVHLTEVELCEEIVAYWESPAHWDEFVAALSPFERRAMTRLALHERCRIDAFMEEAATLGLVILYREHNRYEMPDDVRVQLLERLPSLRDLLRAEPEGDADGTTPV